LLDGSFVTVAVIGTVPPAATPPGEAIETRTPPGTVTAAELAFEASALEAAVMVTLRSPAGLVAGAV